MTTALFFGHATSNVGDVALNLGALGLLASSGVTLNHALLPPTSPRWAEAGRASFGEGIPIIGMRRDAMSWEALGEYCAHPERLFLHYGLGDVETVFIHSGEHFYAHDDPADLHSLALWRMLPALSAKATGRRLVILPSTYGPFAHRGLSRIIMTILNTADAVAAREPLSARAAANLIGRAVPTLLDPAFFLKGTRARPQAWVGSRVGAVMRLEMAGLRSGLTKSATVVEEMRKRGFETTIAMGLLAGLSRELGTDDLLTVFVQARSDDELAASAESQLGGTGHAVVAFERMFEAGVLEYQDALATQDLVIASRFHACVLALSRHVPAVGIALPGHGHKITGLYQLLGLPEHAVSVNGQADVPSALRRIDDLTAGDAELFEPVWPRVEALRSCTTEWLADAMRLPPKDGRHEARRALDHVARMAKRAAKIR